MQTKETDLQTLLDGCRANRRSAQKALYRELYGFAMNITLRYSRDEMDDADIMSHAFIKIFKSIHSFDAGKGSFHAWVQRIVMNEGLDHIKARSRFSKEVELESTVEPAYINNAALEQMGAEEIMNLIRKLPPATHAVFIMYAVEGYNHGEIAKRLRISEGTSKWHLSEARKTLQQQLANQHY